MHDYTDHYTNKSFLKHCSYCICGAYVEESHHLSIVGNQYVCYCCGYYTKNPPTITPGIMSFDDEVLYCYDQEEYDSF